MAVILSDCERLPMAIDRLTHFFSAQATRQGVLARRLLRRVAPGDSALTERVVATLTAELRGDGSIAGALLPTAWIAIALMELGLERTRECFCRMIRWILERQNAPGAFGSGCDPARHGRRICEHFVGGFFAVAPPEARVAPIMFPTGRMLRSEVAARFSVSCMALRAVLLSGPAHHCRVASHAESLAGLEALPDRKDGQISSDMAVSGIAALAVAPPPHGRRFGGLLGNFLRAQAEDGTWPNTDLFHALDALLGIDSPETRAAVRRAAPALLARQRPDGTFGTVAQQERALIGLRALLLVRSELEGVG